MRLYPETGVMRSILSIAAARTKAGICSGKNNRELRKPALKGKYNTQAKSWPTSSGSRRKIHPYLSMTTKSRQCRILSQPPSVGSDRKARSGDFLFPTMIRTAHLASLQLVRAASHYGPLAG